jgi:hypothetical protein
MALSKSVFDIFSGPLCTIFELHICCCRMQVEIGCSYVELSSTLGCDIPTFNGLTALYQP